MIKSLTKKVLMGVSCLIFLAPSVEAESYRSALKKRAKSDLETYAAEVSRLRSGERICSIGVRSVWDEVVTRVLDYGASQGLQPGDRLLAIGGMEIADRDRHEAISQYSPGDSVAVTVERNGSEIDLEIVCDDGTEKAVAFHNMLQAAAKGRWQECVDMSFKADRQNGGQVSYSASYAEGCTEAIRCGSFSCKVATNRTASLLYDLHRLTIEEASIANKLDENRSYILSGISWLENSGFHRFARELESELRDVEVEPSRVAKHARPKEPMAGYGTCFAVSDSEVLTSYHVVEDASMVTVVFADGIEKGAIVLEQSQSTDLALLKINGVTPAFLPLAPMRSLKVGEEVFTLGFPVTSILGTDAKFTEGSVSSLSGIQNDATFFQMSVPVQPGNSGGPVVNVRGEVVGIVAATAAIEAFYTATGSLPQNINWASKSDYAQLLFDAPKLEKRAKDRAEAIEMTYSAICKVTAVSN